METTPNSVDEDRLILVVTRNEYEHILKLLDREHKHRENMRNRWRERNNVSVQVAPDGRVKKPVLNILPIGKSNIVSG